jgi:hypothetical protein
MKLEILVDTKIPNDPKEVNQNLAIIPFSMSYKESKVTSQ